MKTRRKNVYLKGILVLAVLALLTGVEYAVGIALPWLWAGLLLIALAKAVVVLVEYMHIGKLFMGDEEVHE